MHRRAQGLLARREYSRKELAQRLVRGLRRDEAAVEDAQSVEARDVAAESRGRTELIDAVLDDLTAVGSLSDERFVSAFVDGRIRRGKGPLLIRAELRERGADDALIDRFLTFADAFWTEKVQAVRARRFGDTLPADSSERQRQARFLAGRGFGGDLIRRAFDTA